MRALASPADASPHAHSEWAARWQAVRERTRAWAARLSDAEATGQSMPDASPIKWHLAHTTWFFETFVLREVVPQYTPVDPRFAHWFNSYYEGEGRRLSRAERGRLIHPSLDAVWAYRQAVDERMQAHWEAILATVPDRVRLGLAHEEQHQELMAMDLRHLAFVSPCRTVWPVPAWSPLMPAEPGWVEHPEGLVAIGHAAPDPAHPEAAFAFDCETPRHRTWLAPHRLARALVTEGQWLAFMADGGYRTPALWLSDGWAWVQRERIHAPLYWEPIAPDLSLESAEAGALHAWRVITEQGERAVQAGQPVMHVSHYEADAYARWAQARLPTEAEWEAADAQRMLEQAHGSVWQWTASAFTPYPGFHPAPGTVGEYNGKFMSGQMVLRGSAFATPPHHSRSTYRNFYYPHQRWAFTGLRLAQDA